MQDLLDLRSSTKAVNATAHGSKLVSADFHGAEVEVVRSAAVGRVGIKGIVVRDTKFTFVVVTEKDEVKSEFFLFPIFVGGRPTERLMGGLQLCPKNNQSSASLCLCPPLLSNRGRLRHVQRLLRMTKIRRGRWSLSSMEVSSRIGPLIGRIRSLSGGMSNTFNPTVVCGWYLRAMMLLRE
jgi:hypothetical protein